MSDNGLPIFVHRELTKGFTWAQVTDTFTKQAFDQSDRNHLLLLSAFKSHVAGALDMADKDVWASYAELIKAKLIVVFMAGDEHGIHVYVDVTHKPPMAPLPGLPRRGMQTH